MATLCEYCVNPVREHEECHKHGYGVLCGDCFDALPTGLHSPSSEEEEENEVIDENEEHTCECCEDTMSKKYKMTACASCERVNICDACIATCSKCGQDVCRDSCVVAHEGDDVFCGDCNCDDDDDDDDDGGYTGIFRFAL